MTTVSDIASRALRAMGVLSAGQVADGQKAQDALQYFQDLVNDLPGLRGAPSLWSNTILPDATAYDATDGERIYTQGYAAVITLPDTYVDDDGVEQAQRDLSRVHIVGTGHTQEGVWVYSADTGDWARVDSLALSDDSPFAPQDDGGLVALLAVRMAPDFGEGVTLSNVVVQMADKQLRSFRGRFRRATAAAVDDAYLYLSNTGRAGIADFGQT